MKVDISQKELILRVLPLIRQRGSLYRKCRNVFARIARGDEIVESITNSGIETIHTARTGDYIVYNQTEARERYVIDPEKFRQRYTFLRQVDEEYAEYEPIGKVRAIEIDSELLKTLQLPASFYYEAPWGEQALAQKDDYLVCPPQGKPEIYRIGRKEFFETYELVKA